MKLIFLYGPPAVGKLTVATILAEQTGYKLLHNHLLQNPITEIFPYENPANRLLVREFRLRILEEAVKCNIDLIATFGNAGNFAFSHIDDVIRIIESGGGEVILVQLTADRETLLARVENEFRKKHGKRLTKEKLEHMMNENPDLFETYPKLRHLKIDTSFLQPEQAVEKIQYYVNETNE